MKSSQKSVSCHSWLVVVAIPTPLENDGGGGRHLG
jgi:hypothetical protein